MTKYNITEKKVKEATYRTLVNPVLMDELKSKILDIIVMQKKYKDKDYSAKKLAEDLGTNTRYISAVVNVQFHTNYTSFVNKGFANRQSFYASFFKFMNMTPREYRLQHFEKHPSQKVQKKTNGQRKFKNV